jgi:predicted Zn-dependent protease
VRNPRISPIVFAALAAACATNPATGKKELSLVSEAQETQMGRQADREIAESLGLYADPELAPYVTRIGTGLAAVSERPDLPWSFRVVDDPTVNAFALPGGYIYVTRGILAHLDSEAELAGVLGHEIGHVTARHSVSQISKAQLANVGLGLGMIFRPELRGALGEVAQVGLGLLFLKYGRDDEREADDLGLRYMERGGYDARALRDVFAVLQRTGEAEGGGRVPGWLSTHPSPEDRIERIAARLDQDPRGAARVERQAYLRRIDGIAFGPDPREGFFRDGVFYHPGLRFQIAFPRGWNGVNTKQAVGATSPERDAALVITLSRHGSPEAAARELLAQTGIRSGPARSARLGGAPALAYEFVAATSQGELRGLALFAEHAGRVLQLVGYADSARWGSHDGPIQASLDSFGELRDRRLLQARPQRLELVTLPRAMTLREADQRYPSSEPIEALARLNRVDQDGRLRAGTSYKRVVGGVGDETTQRRGSRED